MEKSPIENKMYEKITSKKKKRNWFKEIVLLIIIIAFLIAACPCKLTGAQSRARDAARKANLNVATEAILMFYKDNGYYPTGNCLNEIEEYLVPEYIESIPEDPQTTRIVYGTKVEGCPPGQFGYKSIKRNGESNSGFVLIASIESEGMNGNFVIGGKGIINFVSDCKENESCISKQNQFNPGWDEYRDANVFSFDDTRELEKVLCQKITFNKKNKNYFCDEHSQEGSASEGNYVYVVTQ